MDDETRYELDKLKERVSALASSVQTLQLLAQFHDEEIKTLAVPPTVL